jgi:hypothetical protein
VTERLQAHVPGGQRPSVSPSELTILAGTFNFGFQLFYLADSEAVPAELLSTGRELLLRPLWSPGPTRPQGPRRPSRGPLLAALALGPSVMPATGRAVRVVTSASGTQRARSHRRQASNYEGHELRLEY